MVQSHMLWKKRLNDDRDDMDFVMDPNPVGVSPNGLPIFREINDPLFSPQTFSTVNYKQVNTQDIYGMHSTILVRPGVRKVRQVHIQMVVKQRQNDFQVPSVALAFLGIRPIQYDSSTFSYTSPYDYFFIDTNVNMVCENSRKELSDNSIGHVWDTLNSVGVVPDAINFSDPGDGTFRHFPLLDASFYTNWTHTATTTLNSQVYTTHELSSPILSHFADTTNLTVGNGFELKFQFYSLYPSYLDVAVNTPDPVLSLLESDSIASLTGYADII